MTWCSPFEQKVLAVLNAAESLHVEHVQEAFLGKLTVFTMTGGTTLAILLDLM